jgi:hypothetical protein
MKSGKNLLYLVLGLAFLVSACRDGNGKGDYSGVSDLISDRNKARYHAAENPPEKTRRPPKKAPVNTSPTPSGSSLEKEELSSIVLYDEDIEIVGAESGRTLAKGIAYINKKGQIVRIKILKDQRQ